MTKKLALISILLPLLLNVTAAAQSANDACHVYVVDVKKGRKASEEYRDTGNANNDYKALLAAQTTFPEFYPTAGEEELTTKTYPFPGHNLIITASVYYTDESMASAQGADSMIVGVVVSGKAHRDALSVENNAVAEVTDNRMDTVRAKKHTRIGGKEYLIGIECQRKRKAEQK